MPEYRPIPDSDSRSDKVRVAIDRLRVGLEANRKQRERELEDLAFQDPSGQWPKDQIGYREAQTVNLGLAGTIQLPARPCLSIPVLEQPIQLNINQANAAHLGVTIHAITEDATDETAEMLQGLYRAIEVDSNANQARMWGFTRALLSGRGAYRVNTVYDENSADPFDQKIVIERLLYQESVVFDPFAEKPDWSDGNWAFVARWYPWKEFQRAFSKSKLSGYAEDDLLEEMTLTPDWIRGDKESRAVLVAEYWRVDRGTKTIRRNGREREQDVPKVYVCKITAVDEVEAETEWNGRYIPLIPVIGRELIPFDHERRWSGMIRPNKDAARLVNYAASNAVEIAALETKAQFDVDPQEIQGFESFWAQANVRNFPYLPRHKFTPSGQPFPDLKRIQADMSRLGPSMALLEQGREFVRIGTGAFEPVLGEQSSRAKSGRAVLALQQQHEAGNSNWLENLVTISFALEAKVVLDLIPTIYDRPGRVEHVLDQENKRERIILNCPFLPGQGKQAKPQALQIGPDGRPMMPEGCDPSAVKTYDLSKGRYGVITNVGKGYKSRLEEGADALGTLIQAQPELFQIVGDVWASFQSWPGHKVVEERIKKMLPEALRDEQEQPNAAAQLGQMQQAMEQLQQQLAQAAEMIKTEQVKVDAQVAMKKLETDARLETERIRAATQLSVAHIQAAAKGLQIDQHAQEEMIALGHQALQSDLDRSHEAQQADMDRAHEAAIVAMQPQPQSPNGGEPTE